MRLVIHSGGMGSVHAVGIDGKGCCVCLEFGHSRRVIRLSHAWLINSDRSVRIPRLIGTACPPYHIVVRKKETEWMERRKFWLLLLLIVFSTCLWFPANLEVIADLLILG